MTLQYRIGFLNSGEFLDLEHPGHHDPRDFLPDVLKTLDLQSDRREPPRYLDRVNRFGQRSVLKQPGKRN